jgi:RNA polymerase sigma-70 factor (sigma-E family)
VRDMHEQEYTDYVSAKLMWLRRTAYLLCQDWHRADDIAQTTITSLYMHWHKARVADNLDAYVRTMLVRTFLSDRRSAWSRRVRLVDTVPETAAAGADPDLPIALRAAIGSLPARQRATLVLRFYCDLTVEDTAAAMGCGTGTVKSQSARALHTLRIALGSRTFIEKGATS